MSSPCHLPEASWNAKPGMPVSTPQISWPRFLTASRVALLTSDCAQLALVKPITPATTAPHVANFVICRNIKVPPLVDDLVKVRALGSAICRAVSIPGIRIHETAVAVEIVQSARQAQPALRAECRLVDLAVIA